MRFLWMMIILLAAAWQDVRERKISNRLILFGLAGICAIRYAAEKRGGIISAGCSCIIIICLFFPLFLIHVIGAGDIKLFSLVAAMRGLEKAFQVCIFWFLLAGIVSLWKLLSKHRLHQRITYVWRYVKSWTGKHVPYYDRKRDGLQDTIPLAPFLAISYSLVELGRWKGIW